MRRRCLVWGLGVICGLAVIAWTEWVRTRPDPRAAVRIVDRHGVEVARRADPHYGRREWIALEQIPADLVDAVIAQEDRRFWWHPGVDPLAVGRAVLANLRARRWGQGGSTITQQLAKLLIEDWRGRSVPRTIGWKLAETALALDLELHWTKREILERYLNRVYLGHRRYGVEAAAQAYFGKSVRDVTAGEVRALVSHIQRPNQMRALRRGPAAPDPAPHLVGMLGTMARSRGPHDQVIHTTLDASLQADTLRAVRMELRPLREADPRLQTAIVVIDVATGEVRALVGSEDFADPDRAGQVNHATALRQPGSTLKPFTYFLAFLHHRDPADLVLDAPYHFYWGQERRYTPRNFDRRFRGVLTMREALGNSLNIPAVLAVEELGTAPYLELLRAVGLPSLVEGPTHYGLALTLGSGSVSLLELTNAYATLARGGELRPWRLWMESLDSGTSKELTTGPVSTVDTILTRYPREARARAAYQVTSILADASARQRAFGDAPLMTLDGVPVAVKTGTSHGDRDAWAVGYSPEYVVGVWVGHSDNSPMRAMTGASAAIPIWHAVMRAVHPTSLRRAFPVPAGLARSESCHDAACVVRKVEWVPSTRAAGAPRSAPRESFRLLSPVDGDQFILDPWQSSARQEFLLAARVPPDLAAGQAPATQITWRANGRVIAESPIATPQAFVPLAPGRYEIDAVLGPHRTRPARIVVTEAR